MKPVVLGYDHLGRPDTEVKEIKNKITKFYLCPEKAGRKIIQNCYRNKKAIVIFVELDPGLQLFEWVKKPIRKQRLLSPRLDFLKEVTLEVGDLIIGEITINL